MSDGDEASRRMAIVTATRTCVGTVFRPQGRVVGLGLDCVGVVMVAARAARASALIDTVIPAYRLAGTHGALLEDVLLRMGCEVALAPGHGDVMVLEPRSGQRHLGVRTALGIIHAHAGLGRVVEGPVDPAWRLVGHWRFPGVC